jgi:stage II sporulation protein R
MNFKKLTFILFLFVLLLLNLSIILANSISAKNINNYFRIHVIANSDNIDDQILKLTVAKNVESYINTITKEIKDKNEYISVISNNIYDILNIAEKTISNAGYNYDVSAYIGKMQYDVKTKNNITMPKGIYNSLKITIGNGNGENWWSLLFPYSVEGLETNEIISNSDVKYDSGILNFLNNLISSIY